MNIDGRPRLAVGHVSLEVEDVGEACAFFVHHGMRHIFRGENFGVLELRGGTHLAAKLRRVRQMCSWHRGFLLPKGFGIHENGSTPVGGGRSLRFGRR